MIILFSASPQRKEVKNIKRDPHAKSYVSSRKDKVKDAAKKISPQSSFTYNSKLTQSREISSAAQDSVRKVLVSTSTYSSPGLLAGGTLRSNLALDDSERLKRKEK